MTRAKRSLALIAVVATVLMTALFSAGPVSEVQAAANPDIVRSWGKNEQGQLGNGQPDPATDSSFPIKTLTPNNVVAIAGATAGNHSLALLSDGTVMAWGENQVGNLGRGAVGGHSSTPDFVRDSTGAPGT